MRASGRGTWLAVALVIGFLSPGPAFAQTGARISDETVRVGYLMDMSGQFADYGGMRSVEAARMAVEDFGGKVLGRSIEIVSADHYNKPDSAAVTAREWFDNRKVDAILDVAATGPGLAVLEIAKQKNRIVVFNAPGASRFSNESCSAVSVHYALDSYALGRPLVDYVARRGGDTWFILQLDTGFGVDVVNDVTQFLEKAGGKLVGTVKHPFNASDFSSFVLQAQASRAKVIGLANAGYDTVNSIKSIRDFGLLQSGQQKLVALYILINDVMALGLEAVQGLILSEAWYWDLNEDTRAFAKRYQARVGVLPNAPQASVYSSTLHYLRAVEAAGTDETAAVMEQMRKTPIDDMFAKEGRIREDGRMVHDMYLFEAKAPAESKGPGDVYKLLATIPGDDAYRPLAESKCPLVAKR